MSMEFFNDTLDNLLEELIDYRGKTPIKTTSGIPLVTAKIIKNGVINEFNEFIAERDYDRWMVRGFPKQGDVVLTTEAPLGEVAQLDERKIALAQRVVCLRGKSGVLNNTYLKYYFLSNYGKKKLKSRESGTTVTGIKQSELRKVEVCYPSFENQCKIASTLSSLDSKIENNRKICANLEAQAQALFKHWFIDFAPFKDGKFVESELGMIPEGWRVGSPYEYLDFIYGAPYKSNLFNDKKEGLPLIRIRDLKDCSPQFYTPEVLPKSEYVKAGDILAGMDAEFAPYIWKGQQGLLNQRVCKIKPKSKEIGRFFCMLLVKPQLLFVQAVKTGTTVSHIGKSDIDRFKVILPPLNEVIRFSKLGEEILDEIITVSAESSRLSTLRDTLLPKLMSGEIKV